MSTTSNTVCSGVVYETYSSSNILFGGLTARSVGYSGFDPFFTLYPNLDSPSGFSSWLHPAYAQTSNILANASGFNTTWAPLTSYCGYGGLYGGGLYGGYLGSGLLGGTSFLSLGYSGYSSLGWFC